jgi:aspartyl-tRNA(Asn)/glutamyl-tRNA(Gln) amidotransferase subunit C
LKRRNRKCENHFSNVKREPNRSGVVSFSRLRVPLADGLSCPGACVKISREDVLRVAELAHLELSPDEVETYQRQLDEILTYIAKLEQLDVSQVEPMAQVLVEDVGDAHPELREDVIRPCDHAPAVLAQAADAVKPFFRVPKVIDR